MIDQNGIIYEGRGWGIVGQHTNGQNDKSIGELLNSRLIIKHFLLIVIDLFGKLLS